MRGTSGILYPGEYVAGPTHRDDAARLPWVVLDGKTQAADMDIDRPVEGIAGFALDRIQ
jgi:hypothetical protein